MKSPVVQYMYLSSIVKSSLLGSRSRKRRQGERSVLPVYDRPVSVTHDVRRK